MGRSTKKGVDYFPHDTDASEKTTLFALEARYGNDGYAFWFKLLEVMGKKETASIDCSDINEWFFLLHRVRMEEKQVREILDLLADLKAIDPPLWHDHQIVWSDNFVARLNVVYGKRKEGAPKKPFSEVTPPEQQPATPDDSVTKTPVSDTDDELPFGLTMQEVMASRERDEAIEVTARSNGLPVHEAGMIKANDLASTYGLEALLNAIKIAGLGASQTWRYVEGILKKEAAKRPAAQPPQRMEGENPYAEYFGANQ